MEYHETRKGQYLVSEYERISTKAENIEKLISSKISTRDRLTTEIREHRKKVKLLDKELSALQSQYDKNLEKFKKCQKGEKQPEQVQPEEEPKMAESEPSEQAPKEAKSLKSRSKLLSKVTKLTLGK